MQKKIEILSPCGDLECLNSALNFGADAVYLAYKDFGMRTSSKNFDIEELKQAVILAHKNGVKIYVTCNTIPTIDEINKMPEFLTIVNEIDVDALIIADLGVMKLAQKYAPRVDIHISTQAGVVNHVTANMLYDLGASRVVLARELSLETIAEIRANISPKLEIETFVHGAMCMSFSGRCLISNYLTNRDANRGDCSQPCRWKYHIVEETRDNQYFPIFEDDKGSYFFNSKDMCMIEHIPELIKAGIDSFKIEGRAKSSYYVACITSAYRHALDYHMIPNQNKFSGTPWFYEEVKKISHREYSTGFYFKNEPGQVYENGGYIREWDVVGIVEECKGNMLKVSQRNKFLKGDILEVLSPKEPPFKLAVNDLYDEHNNPIESAPHATQTVYIPVNRFILSGSFIRKKRTK